MGYQTLSQRQCHRGVIGPFTGLQIEGAATDHGGQRLVAITGFEFERGAYSVASR